MFSTLLGLLLLGQVAIPIDVPTPLKEAHVVFNVMTPAPAPPQPQQSLFLAETMTQNLQKAAVPHKVVVIFHSGAASFGCRDAAYNRLTKTTKGNPFAAKVAELQELGIQVEICVKSMEVQKINKDELLPGVLVNGGALLRVIQLTQDGYTQFTF